MLDLVERHEKWLLPVLIFVAAAMYAPALTAQTIPVTISAAPASSAGTVPVTVTWNAPGATSCTASGSWSGTKATSGTQTIQPPIAATQTYSLTCTAPGSSTGSVTLDWTPASTNTNGTPMTPTGHRINYGTSASSLPQVLDVGNVSTAIVSNLAPATWFFTVTTLAGTASSVASSAVSKAVTAGPGSTGTASATHTVTPVPGPPTNVTATVTVPVAFDIRANSTGALVATRIGVIPIGALCSAETRKVGAVTYNRVDTRSVDVINISTWPTATKPLEAWAQCG